VLRSVEDAAGGGRESGGDIPVQLRTRDWFVFAANAAFRSSAASVRPSVVASPPPPAPPTIT